MSGRKGAELPVSSGSRGAQAALDRFAHGLAAIDKDVVAVLEDAERFPECSLLQASAASIYLFAQSRDGLEPAFELLRRARELEGNERERRFNEALASWAAGNTERAVAQLEALLAIWPADLAAVKIAEYCFYLMGQAYHGKRFLRLIESVAPAHDGNPHFDAMRAFALELAGHREQAWRVAQAATEREPATPWAHHALAHVYSMRGDLEAGLERLTPELQGWANAGRAVHGHNAWHLAVLHVEACDPAAALELYHEHVFGHHPASLNEQVDAASLLWRLELGGWPQDALWPSLAAHIDAELGPWLSPFVAVHLVFALARAGLEDGVARALAGARELASSGPPGRRETWREVGLPLLEAALAFASGRDRACSDQFARIAGQVQRAGGSDAQNALFLQAFWVAALRAGRSRDAEVARLLLLGDRVRETPLEARWRTGNPSG